MTSIALSPRGLISTSTRTNLATDPGATAVIAGAPTAGKVGWSDLKWFGASGTGSYSTLTGQTAPTGTGVTTAVRKTWTAASTSQGDSGFLHTGTNTAALPVTAGTVLALASYLRTNATGKSAAIFVTWRDSAGTALVSNVRVGSTVALGSSWTRIGGTVTAPANTAYAEITSTIESSSTAWASGNTLDGTALLVEKAATLGTYFSGSTASGTYLVRAWSGTTNASTSTETTYVDDPDTQADAVLIDGFESEREIRNQVHPIIGSAEPSYTLRAAGPRSGRIRYLFSTWADAAKCETVHSRPGIITVTDPDLPAGSLSYIATDSASVVLDQSTQAGWTVETGFMEVQ